MYKDKMYIKNTYLFSTLFQSLSKVRRDVTHHLSGTLHHAHGSQHQNNYLTELHLELLSSQCLQDTDTEQYIVKKLFCKFKLHIIILFTYSTTSIHPSSPYAN